MPPELLNLFFVIVVFGLVLWMVNRFIPMAAPVATILNVLVVVVLVIYILEYFHLIPTIVPMISLIRSGH
ncbi:MAG: hypothetical protein KBB94_00915 [Legionellaceae bacterium]|nr:hypothetical protein [Legionellaceae bacterium]MBP9774283.1 hypothetical protein [Legionellaceae bacterium]